MADDFYHFIATGYDNNLENKKVILAGEWCIKKFSDKNNFEKNTILIENIWRKIRENTPLTFL